MNKNDNQNQHQPRQSTAQIPPPESGAYRAVKVYTPPSESPDAHREKIEAILNDQAKQGWSLVLQWPHPFEMCYVQAIFRKNEKEQTPEQKMR